MVPELLADTIENDGERTFYEKASKLPDFYTVFYSYKFMVESEQQDPFGIREADFVIVHPQLGFIVVEVKQGQIHYHSGVWNELKNGNYLPLYKNPVQQAQTAMFAILERYKQVTKQKRYPLQCRFAVCFPETTAKVGIYPEGLQEESCWTAMEMDNLEKTILKLFSKVDTISQSRNVHTEHNDLISIP